MPGRAGATIAERLRQLGRGAAEWALAGCAAFIAAPRRDTLATDLGGAPSCHDYWGLAARTEVSAILGVDPDRAGCRGKPAISLQFMAHRFGADVFGGGNKLIHNVVGASVLYKQRVALAPRSAVAGGA